MPKYWGLHHSIREDEIKSFHQGKEKDYRGIPEDAGIDSHDIVFLFRGNEYLYGWGTVASLGTPYAEPSGQRVIDIKVNPVVLEKIADLEQVKGTPAFKDSPWEKKAGAISSLNSEQIETLRNFLPAGRSRPPASLKEIPEGWERLEQQADLSGGQGTIIKVRRKGDGQFGALKRLHPEHLDKTERRYRMQQEVNALLVLGGIEIPAVLESNTEAWKERGVPLYVIMDWIDGVTLGDYVRRSTVSLDAALTMTLSLLDVIERCHEYSIFHRDIKPDNIIVRSGNPSTLALVDFGMSWSKPSENEPEGFRTRADQELGNRFLRLPEYAPGRKVRDSRSDLTMIVGLLFYLITKRAPRQLLDEEGRMPHVALADAIPENVRADSHWPSLERLFNVGFQYRLEDRFQTSNQLRQAINRLLGSQEERDILIDEFAGLKELLETPQVRLPKLALGHLTSATNMLHESLQSYFAESDLEYEDRRAVFDEPEIGSNFHCGVYRADMRGIHASLDHQIRFVNSQYVAAYMIEGGTWSEYYRGQAVDPRSLEEAISERAIRMARELVYTYRERLRTRIGKV